MKKALLLLMLLVQFTAKCQSEFYTIDSSLVSYLSANCIVQLPDSGYVIGGEYLFPPAYNNSDQTITRLDKNGQLLWQKGLTIGSTDEECSAVYFTSKNRIVSCAKQNAACIISHFDLSGNVINSVKISYSGSYADIAEDANHNIYLLFGSDYLVKTDSTGTLLWQKKIAIGNSSLSLKNIHLISDTKIILSGHASHLLEPNSNTDIVHICINDVGNVLWSKAIGNKNIQSNFNSVLTDDYKIISLALHRWTNDETSFILICSDTLGQFLWSKSTSSTFLEGGANLALLLDGTIAVVSDSASLFSIDRYTKNGDFISGFTSATPNLGNDYSFSTTNDGGLFLVFYSGYGNWYKMKFNSGLTPHCISYSKNILPELLQQNFNTQTIISSSTTYNLSSTNSTTNVLISMSDSTLCISPCQISASILPDRTRTCINSTVNFINQSQNATNYQWFVDDTLRSTSLNFNFTFSLNGLHVVKLIVENGFCIDSSFCSIFIDLEAQPSFSTSIKNLKAIFIPTNGIGIYEWSFGDATTSFLASDTIIHNYESQGEYLVCLNETNSCGTEQSCQSISINPENSYSFLRHYVLGMSPNSGLSLEQSADGGFYIVGIGERASNNDASKICKTDEAGNVIWASAININFYYTEHVTETYNGDILMAGSYTDCKFSKIDSSGIRAHHLEFTQPTGTDITCKPIELKDNSIIWGAGANCGIIFKTDANLNLIWIKKYTGFTNLRNIFLNDDGSFLLFGSANGSSTSMMMKVDENGDFMWAKIIDLGNSSYCTYACKTKDGNYLITGSSLHTSVRRPILIKVDPLGNPIWTKTYKYNNLQIIGHSVVEDDQQNIWICAGYLTNNDSYLLKIDSIGNIINSQLLEDVLAQRIINTQDGGIAFSGYKENITNVYQQRYILNKIDSTNNFVCYGQSIIFDTIATTWTTSIGSSLTSTPPTLVRAFHNMTLLSTVDSTTCSSYVPALEAQFTNQGNCAESSVELNDNSQGNITSWYWTFQGGNPSTSSDQNPTVIWAAPGIYSITLTIANAMDTSTIEQLITINSNLAIVNAGTDQSICPGDTINLSGTGNGVLTWNASSSISNTSSPSTEAFPVLTENYILTVTDISGCTKSDSVTVFVYSGTIDAGPDLSICPGDSIQLQSTIIANAFNWAPSLTLSDPTIQMPFCFPTTQTTYYLSGSFGVGCILSDSTTVSVYTNAQTPLTNQIICSGDSIQVNLNSIVSCNWTPNTEIIYDSFCNTIYLFPNLSTTYYANYIDQNNCAWSDSIVITVNALPSTPTILVSNDTLYISQGGSNYQWYFNNSIISGANLNYYVFSSDGNYSVNYSNGFCWSDTAMVLIVGENEIFGEQISVYPNPTEGNIYISSQSDAIIKYLISDNQGRIIQEKLLEIPNKYHSIDLLNESPGIYFLTIYTQKYKQVFKIIKQ